MSTTYNQAIDAVLGQLKVAWDANTTAIAGYVPHLVYEFLEADLQPHPKDSGKIWARVTVRHNDSNKASLANSDKVARYRRVGWAHVELYVPATFGSDWTLAQTLAEVAQQAYEGKRTTSGASVVFTHVQLIDHPRDAAWVRKDVKAYFYWDQVR